MILLSEVLLQRTQAQQVAASFDSIMAQFPSVHALAAASDELIRSNLYRLGLEKRAVTLKAMAVALVDRYSQFFPMSSHRDTPLRGDSLSDPPLGALRGSFFYP